jgi:hypothetical protein
MRERLAEPRTCAGRWGRDFIAAAVLAALASCSTEVPATNPYDPATPLDSQAKAAVRGVVVATPTLPTSAGLAVTLAQAAGAAREVSTGTAGAFLFENLTPGSYLLTCAPTGFVSFTVAVTLVQGQVLDLGTIPLSPLSGADASAFTGRVTLEAGADLGGTLVEAAGRGFTTVTDSAGNYRLQVVAGTYDLRFSRAGFVTQAAPGQVVARGEARALGTVTLLANPARLSGHVDGERPDGTRGPLENAVVTLEGTSITGLTNAQGDFTLTAVPQGSYLLRVALAGYVSASEAVLNVVGGELRTLPDPVFLPLARGRVVGRVALAGTTDASGAVVSLTGSGIAVVTGADGAFGFDALVGQWALTARRDGYSAATVSPVGVVAGQIVEVGTVTLGRTGGAVSIREAPCAAVRTVHLLLDSPGALGFKRSEDPSFTDALRGDVAASPWRPYVQGQAEAFTLADADGEHAVYVVFQTSGGPTPAASATVVLDRQAPQSPTVVIGSGAAATRAPGGIVSLTLSAVDLPPTAGAAVSGLARMELSNVADFSVRQAVDYARTWTWTLDAPGTQGEKTVYARFVDGAGNVSATATATVLYDTVAPDSLAIALVGGDAGTPGYTRTPVVTVNATVHDANGGPGNQDLFMRLSNTDGMVGATWQPFAAQTTWLLAPGDGAKTVWAEFMDAAGNVSARVSATIQLDTRGPTAPALSVAEQDPRPANGYTSVATVRLTLAATGAAWAVVAENQALTGGQAFDLATMPVSWVLGAAGPHTLWVRFYDPAGNASELASASVTLDQQAPAATPPALAPSGFTSGYTVLLTPPAAGQDELLLAGDLAAPVGWTAAPAGVAVPVTLSAGAGVKSLGVTYRDLADNVTFVTTVTVTVDTAAPTGTPFTITGRTADGVSSTSLTATPNVTLDLRGASDPGGSGVSSVLISNDAAFAGATWQPYAASSVVPWTLSPGDAAVKAVYVRYRDAVGNASSPVTGSIELLETPPAGASVVVEGGAPSTSKQVVDLREGASGAAQMSVCVDGLCGSWIAYATTATANLGLVDRVTKVVTVRFRSRSLVEGGSASAAIYYDFTPPPAGTLALLGTLGNGASSSAYTTALSVVARPGAAAADVAEMALASAASAAGCAAALAVPSWQPYAPTATFLLPGGDGDKTVCMVYRDETGNWTAASFASASLTLDTTPPSNPSFTDLVSGHTNQPVVVANVTAKVPAETYQCFGGQYGAVWADCSPAAPPFSWALLRNQPNTVGVRLRDAAYNASAGTLVELVHDDVAPLPPRLTSLHTGVDSVTVAWEPPADPNVVSFRVYYGNATGDSSGVGASQGPSAVSVSANGQASQSFSLTGLSPGLAYYVSVASVDSAGNEGLPSGQLVGAPGRVNPRILSVLGGELAAAGARASGAKLFVYALESQGIVQLDATSTAAEPLIVGRAFIPNFFPNPRGQPVVVLDCTVAGAAGHCVIPAGASLEGATRANLDPFRVSAPIVHFRLDGTTAAPTLGTLQSTLPGRAFTVVADPASSSRVYTVEDALVRLWSVANPAFPVQVAQGAVAGTPLQAVMGAGASAADGRLRIWAWPTGYGATDPDPQLHELDVSAVASGTISDVRQTVLRRYDPQTVATVVKRYEADPAFLGTATFLFGADWAGSLTVSRYAPGAQDPEAVATLACRANPTAVGTRLYATCNDARGLQQVLTAPSLRGGAVGSGYGSAAVVYELGGTVFGTNDQVFGSAQYFDSGAGRQFFSLQRWDAPSAGGTPTYRAAGAYRELTSTTFVEKDRFLYATSGAYIDVIDVSNPLLPRIVSRNAPRALAGTSRSYRTAANHGEWMFVADESVTGVTTTWSIDRMRVSGAGALTYTGTVTTAPGLASSLVVRGRYLYAALGTGGLAVYDVGGSGAPVLLASYSAAGVSFDALDARPTQSANVNHAGVIYAARHFTGSTTNAGELQTFLFDVSPLTTAITPLSLAVSVPTGLATSVTARGSQAVVSGYGGSSVAAVSAPASPSFSSLTHPVTGPALVQGGYLVGVQERASGAGVHGPVFGALATGQPDGALLYTECGSYTDASLVAAGATYFAGCGRNGLSVFSAASPDTARLLKRFDVTGSWMQYGGGALATDGSWSFIGDVDYAGDTSRLYSVSELVNASSSPLPPTWNGSASVGAGNDAAYLLHVDGLTLAFTGAGTVQAFDTSNVGGTWPLRWTISPGVYFGAQPVTDGNTLWTGGYSGVQAFDLRAPGINATPSLLAAVDLPGSDVAALAASRDRLYVGTYGTTVEVFDTAGGLLTHLTTVATSPASTYQMHGLAVEGPYLIFTYEKSVRPYNGISVMRLGPNRDGAGATFVGNIELLYPPSDLAISGDLLFVMMGKQLLTYDLTPLWKTGALPEFVSASENLDGYYSGRGRLILDGPFGYFMGEGYRAFDLR